VALGDVAVLPLRLGRSLNPFGFRQCSAHFPYVLRSTLVYATSLILFLSLRSFNYQQSVFSHVLQSSGVQLAEDFHEAFSSLWLIVIYARNLHRSEDPEINIV